MTFIKILTLTCAMLLGASIAIANPQNANIGTVAETMISGGYVYVRLEEDGSWLASMPTELKVGDKVRYSTGMVMQNFTAPSLNRSFDTLRLVERLEVIGELDANAHMAAASTNPHGFEKSAEAGTPQAGDITPLDGGKTVTEVITEAEQLKDQEVALRARVMKVNKNILGKNWITLQDGTGAAPDDKLVTTSSELVEVGDVVIAKGVVKTDVDIGSGYKYKVMLEGVTFSK